VRNYIWECTYPFYGNLELVNIKCKVVQFLRTVYKLIIIHSLRFLCFLSNFRLAGVVFIIFGLYSVLWGKGKEVEQARIADEVEAATKYCEKEDSESWLHLHVNGKSRQDPN